MTDRELLELAAKAAGLRYIKPSADYSGALGLALCDEHGRLGQDWSPLADDGDALRLAVALMVSVEISEHEASTYAYAGSGERVYAMELWRQDKNAATRRAIVRAAAEIGKAQL